VQASTSEKEASLLVGEIAKLAQANVTGDDSNGDGVVDQCRRKYGLVQLRKSLEDMIAGKSRRMSPWTNGTCSTSFRLPNASGVRQVWARRQY